MTIDTMIARVKDATARNDDLVCIEAEDRDALLAHIATLEQMPYLTNIFAMIPFLFLLFI